MFGVVVLGADPRTASWRVWAASQAPVPVLSQEVPLVGLCVLAPATGRSQLMGLNLLGCGP